MAMTTVTSSFAMSKLAHDTFGRQCHGSGSRNNQRYYLPFFPIHVLQLLLY
jgi:hypothetical protein